MRINRRNGNGGCEPTAKDELSVVRRELDATYGPKTVEAWIEKNWIHPDALEEVKVMLLKAKLKE